VHATNTGGGYTRTPNPPTLEFLRAHTV